MSEDARPLLVVYVIWHPDFREGQQIADGIRDHFRRKLYENVVGGTGLSVIYRFVPASAGDAPLAIDLSEAYTTAIVVLVDSRLVLDSKFVGYVRQIADDTEAAGLHVRLFPVIIEPAVVQALGIDEQGIRWDEWVGGAATKQIRLIGELTYEFCRMLRYYLERLKRPNEDEAALTSYLKKVQVFLSHSKHDAHGEHVAYAIRDHINAGHGLTSFFDVHDIPSGLRFHNVLLHHVRVSAMIAIHTDSYSSREWCRREVIEAKRHNVPLVVANCINDQDERGFPYLGNVPIVRVPADASDRIAVVIGRLLDEVLKDFLWRCRVELTPSAVGSGVVFLPRPPELICLASIRSGASASPAILVYPDPPVSAEEERLFFDVAPNIQLRSLTEWLAGAVR